MSRNDNRRIVKALLDTYGHTFSEELKLGAERNTPSGLFQLLCFSLLSSNRISHELAGQAMTALRKQGWRTPRKMADTTWRERTDVLNHAGYARYDESTSRYLADMSQHLLEAYDGDLRKLRDEAGHDPDQERRRLEEFKGIGKSGASIFCREAQGVWNEIAPYADKKTLKAAGKLGLPTDAAKLADTLRRKKDLPRLVAALVRCDLDNGYAKVREAAAS